MEVEKEFDINFIYFKKVFPAFKRGYWRPPVPGYLSGRAEVLDGLTGTLLADPGSLSLSPGYQGRKVLRHC